MSLPQADGAAVAHYLAEQVRQLSLDNAVLRAALDAAQQRAVVAPPTTPIEGN